MRGISESLGLEESYIQKRFDFELASQLLVVNLYPPCPEPDVAIGLPPHTDHGLLTLLMQNELSGLQVMHNGKWVPVNDPPPNSFLVNIGDHMEVHLLVSTKKNLTPIKDVFLHNYAKSLSFTCT
jgi:isopenicillin N synthase-like dioxygenase